MCGIIGYSGPDDSVDFVLQGLKQLEYRGYDSYGILINNSKTVWSHYKGIGSVQDCIKGTLTYEYSSPIIGHTRWATHGEPGLANAHPIISFNNQVAVVHNGTVTNHKALRRHLESFGYTFHTDTDTEVIANLLDFEMMKIPIATIEQDMVYDAVSKVIDLLKGDNAFLFVLSKPYYTGTLFAYAKNMPLFVTPNGYICSDKSVLNGVSKACRAIESEELVTIKNGSSTGWKFDIPLCDKPKVKDEDEAGSHMLREIREQVELVKMLEPKPPNRNRPKSITFVGCGSSYYAGMFARCIMREVNPSIKTSVEYASEILYHMDNGHLDDEHIFISQSGYTKDTLEACQKLIDNNRFYYNGLKAACVTNDLESPLASFADYKYDILAGPEIGVAATKTFLSSCKRLLDICFDYSSKTPPDWSDWKDLSDCIKKFLNPNATAPISHKVKNILVLGHGLYYPMALEGALKIKEVSYIHAEAMPAAELKHGPLALIDKDTPTIVLASSEQIYRERIRTNMEQIKARGGPIITLTDDPGFFKDVSDSIIFIPTPKNIYLKPLIFVVAMQMMAYNLARAKGLDVDKPRNLAKCVTVD